MLCGRVRRQSFPSARAKGPAAKQGKSSIARQCFRTSCQSSSSSSPSIVVVVVLIVRHPSCAGRSLLSFLQVVVLFFGLPSPRVAHRSLPPSFTVVALFIVVVFFHSRLAIVLVFFHRSHTFQCLLSVLSSFTVTRQFIVVVIRPPSCSSSVHCGLSSSSFVVTLCIVVFFNRCVVCDRCLATVVATRPCSLLSLLCCCFLHSPSLRNPSPSFTIVAVFTGGFFH